MKISITAQDIKNGKACSRNSCPVALAIKKALPGCPVWVDSWFIDIIRTELEFPLITAYHTNDKIERFIKTFDEGGRVKPFSFDLDKLPKVNKLEIP